MKIIVYAVLMFLVIIYNSKAQQGWYILSQYQSTGGSITDMKFTTGETGYSTFQAGNGHYNYGGTAKTTNGGLNWFSLEEGVPKYGMYFLNNNTGWMTGGYWDDAGKRSREVFKTTNSGINFTRVYIDSTLGNFWDIFFADVNTGWMTASSVLLKSTNSGVNWSTCLNSQIYSIYFINVNTGWSTGSNGQIWKTTNGGLNWTVQTLGSNSLYEVFFIDANTGWVSGGSVFIHKTTNGGANWNSYNTGQYTIHSIEFFDQNKGWACGDTGKIIYTSNGGINWIQQNSGVNHYLSILCFPNALTGYIRGSKIVTMYPFTIEEVFLKTITGGITPVQNISSEIPEEFSLHQNYPNPFNPVTKIKFQIPSTPLSSIGEGPGVRLIIYDILGREITNLIPPLRGGQEGLQPGMYEVEWDGSNSPSGVYFYKLITSDYSETKKMVLIK